MHFRVDGGTPEADPVSSIVDHEIDQLGVGSEHRDAVAALHVRPRASARHDPDRIGIRDFEIAVPCPASEDRQSGGGRSVAVERHALTRIPANDNRRAGGTSQPAGIGTSIRAASNPDPIARPHRGRVRQRGREIPRACGAAVVPRAAVRRHDEIARTRPLDRRDADARQARGDHSRSDDETAEDRGSSAPDQPGAIRFILRHKCIPSDC